MIFNPSKTNAVITSIVSVMFECMKIDWQKLSDDEKTKKSNELIQELENIYSLLLENIHGPRSFKVAMSYFLEYVETDGFKSDKGDIVIGPLRKFSAIIGPNGKIKSYGCN
ncbi:unnamed protein product [Rotaria socialis]|uniref:Uncharacterized protein n=1 Tax=Rotaria socialis TaxID=392032 RepID=A0A820Z537_9BILA|nr:unnamed protein product [Rotaria socialis]